MRGTGLGTTAVVLQGENKYWTEVNYMLSYVVKYCPFNYIYCVVNSLLCLNNKCCNPHVMLKL